VIAEADTTAVDTGACAIDADAPAIDMIGQGSGVFATEATHVFTNAADVFAAKPAAKPADMATAHAADMTATEATAHVTAAEASTASHVAATTTSTARLGAGCQQAAGQHSRCRHHHQSFHHGISFFLKGNARHAAVTGPAKRAAIGRSDMLEVGIAPLRSH
jgi:hypothetical protein